MVEWVLEIIFNYSKFWISALESCKNVQVLEISINRLQDLYQSILRIGFSKKKYLKREVVRDYVKGRFLKTYYMLHIICWIISRRFNVSLINIIRLNSGNFEIFIPKSVLTVSQNDTNEIRLTVSYEYDQRYFWFRVSCQ